MARLAKKTSSDDDGPERTCVVTRAHRPPEEMIRFVLDPAGQVVPDLKRKLPGRGVWVTATASLVVEAAKRGAFSRGFKRPVSVPPDIVEIIDRTLEKDLLQSLSLANKAGLVAAGAFQVEKALCEAETGVLIHASDGGADGARKFRQALRRNMLSPENVYCLEILNSEQIGLALGRTSVVHAALRRGAAAEALITRARRLEIFRGGCREFGSSDPQETELTDPSGSEDGHGPGSRTDER